MKRSITACLLPALACLALASASAAQTYPPPPSDPGSYDDQGYPDQEPYYQPPPDGSYEDQTTYDDQAYPDQTAYDNQDNQYADPSDTRGPVDESVFYGELSPYGRWFQRGSYGWVWEPTRVAVGWRPYTQGHWVETDDGWTWISDEPWGWATYHYGRWMLDPDYGWLWVPGTEWAPSWVSFQEGNGYIGWAPLPPSVGFRAGFGIQIGGLSLSAEINPLAYSFVPARSFLSERIAVEIAPPARNVTFIRGSRNITNIRVENNRVVNRSIPVERIQEATGRPVHRYRLNEVRNPAQGRVSRVQGDQVTVFRPAPTLVQARPDNTPPAVIQRRQRLAQQRQGGQPQGGQPQPVQPQPGRAQAVPRLSGADLNRKHQTEQQQLQARQNAERRRLQQEHQQQQANQQTRGKAPDLPAQQQAEQRALQDQQKREQQLLEARHQRERQAPQATQNRPPAQQGRPAQPQNQPRETQQRRNREQERAREEQQQRDKQPPPPPPGR